MYTVLLVIHTIVVLFLIGIVLIQRSDSDGMGLGGGGGQFMSGRAQANLLTRTTAILAAIFMGSSLILAVMAGNTGKRSVLDQLDQPAAVETVPAEQPAPAQEAPKPDTAPAVPKPE